MSYNRVLSLMIIFIEFFSFKYFDPSQYESDQKDIIISQLKADLFELKKHFKDYDDLSKSQINLENQYSVLLDDKTQEELGCKTVEEKDQMKIQKGKQKIDQLKQIMNGITQEADQLKGKNLEFKNNIDKYEAEIEKCSNQLEEIQETNEKYTQEIEYLQYNYGNFQSDINLLARDSDLRSSKLLDYQANLSQIEKNIKNQQYSVEELHKLIKDKTRQNELIISEIKKKNELLKEVEIQICNQNENSIKKEEDILQMQKQIQTQKIETQETGDLLQDEIINCKDMENQIEVLTSAFKLRKDQQQQDQQENDANLNEHNELRNDNKILNTEITNYLNLIQELIEINKTLEIEIQQLLEEDDNARQLLARKDLMKKAVQQNNREIEKSYCNVSGIKELKLQIQSEK